MTEIYPGYNVDPRVRQVIDRCLAIGIRDFNKQYSNKEELFRFSSLERDVCRPAKVPVKGRAMLRKLIRTNKPGVIVLKGIAHTSAEKPNTDSRARSRTTAAYRTRYVESDDEEAEETDEETDEEAEQRSRARLNQYAGGIIRI